MILDYTKMSTEELTERAAKGDLNAEAMLKRGPCGQGVRRAWGIESCDYRQGHAGKCKGEY